MRFKSKGLKKVVGANVVIIALLFLTLSAYAGSVPNVFTSGMVAKSSEVNANFTYLGDRCWDKSGNDLVYSNGSIGVTSVGDFPAINLTTQNYGIYFKDTVTNRDDLGFYIGNNGANAIIGRNVKTRMGSWVSPAPTKRSQLIIFGSTEDPDQRNDGHIYFNTREENHVLPYGTTKLIIRNEGNVGIGQTTPSYPLHMGSGAYVTTGGVWTNASSREYKKDIQSLTSEDAMLAFNKLEPVSFKYKTNDEQHIGFIAEDVPDLVASKDRKGLSTMDVVALLTKVVQEQQKTIAELQEEVRALKEITR